MREVRKILKFYSSRNQKTKKTIASSVPEARLWKLFVAIQENRATSIAFVAVTMSHVNARLPKWPECFRPAEKPELGRLGYILPNGFFFLCTFIKPYPLYLNLKFSQYPPPLPEAFPQFSHNRGLCNEHY